METSKKMENNISNILNNNKKEILNISLIHSKSFYLNKKKYNFENLSIKNNISPHLNMVIINNVNKTLESLEKIKLENFLENDIKNILNNDKYKLIEFDIFIKLLEITNKMQIDNSINSNWTFFRDCTSEKKISDYIHVKNGIPSFKFDPYFVQIKQFDDNTQLCIIGDIHSCIYSYLDILIELKYNYNIFDDDWRIKEGYALIFLGDILDRGPFNIELLSLILVLKIINFNCVFIINGNHEDPSFCLKYSKKLNLNTGTEIYHKYKENGIIFDESENTSLLNFPLLISVLYNLPVCIFIKFKSSKNVFQFCHGGFDLSKKTKNNTPFPYIFNLDNVFNIHNLSNKDCYILLEEHPVNNGGFKWLDFHNKKINNKIIEIDNYTNRLSVDNTVINLYFSNFNKNSENKIVSIISGHQDLINLGIIIKNNKIPNNIDGTVIFDIASNKKKYKINFIADHYYYKKKLYHPDFNTIKTDIKTSDNNEPAKILFSLDPVNDFYALRTSTATITKNVYYDIFMILKYT
jgi:hypothetical protein